MQGRRYELGRNDSACDVDLSPDGADIELVHRLGSADTEAIDLAIERCVAGSALSRDGSGRITMDAVPACAIRTRRLAIDERVATAKTVLRLLHTDLERPPRDHPESVVAAADHVEALWRAVTAGHGWKTGRDPLADIRAPLFAARLVAVRQLATLGEHTRALRRVDEIARDSDAAFGLDDVWKAVAGMHGAYAFAAVGRFDRALTVGRPVAARRQRYRHGGVVTPLMMHALGALYTAAGKYAEGIMLFKVAATELDRAYPATVPTGLTLRTDVALAFLVAGRFEEATARYSAALEVGWYRFDVDHPRIIDIRRKLQRAQHAGDLPEEPATPGGGDEEEPHTPIGGDEIVDRLLLTALELLRLMQSRPPE